MHKKICENNNIYVKKCKNNYIQKNKGMLLSRHRTTKERERNVTNN